MVRGLRRHLSDLIVVDDGSNAPAREVLRQLEQKGMAHIVRRDRNGGKGAAVKTGLAVASQLGFTHALQIDADGQHDLTDVPKFLQVSMKNPEALILGTPLFDASAPKARLWGRRLTNFWVRIQTRSRSIADALCGFRIYPIAAALAANARSNRMDFDPEIAVRMVWHGTEVINIATNVRYLDHAEGGVSHFRPLRDNLLVSWMHTRLTLVSVFHLVFHRQAPSD
jgi:glycosyltransferase involved in cell wall biosynthesis